MRTNPINMHRPINIIAILALCLWTGAPAFAQESGYALSKIGGRAGNTMLEGGASSLMAVFHLEFMRAGSHWHIAPELRFWNEAELQDLNPNLNAYYHISPEGRVSPYVGLGGGVHFYDVDSVGADGDTDASLNALAGVLFPLSRHAHFLVEGRYAFTDLGQLDVMGGFSMPLTQ